MDRLGRVVVGVLIGVATVMLVNVEVGQAPVARALSRGADDLTLPLVAATALVMGLLALRFVGRPAYFAAVITVLVVLTPTLFGMYICPPALIGCGDGVVGVTAAGVAIVAIAAPGLTLVAMRRTAAAH